VTEQLPRGVIEPDTGAQARRALTPAQAFDIGVGLHRQGRLGEAERVYRAILKLNADHFGALHYLGTIATQAGKPQEAERLIRRALRLDANSAEAHNNLGIALAALKRFDEAIDQFEEALAISPGAVELHNNLGKALTAANRHEAAVEHLQTALTIDPGNAVTETDLGNALAVLGRHAEASGRYRRAMALAERHRRAGRLDAAEQICRQLLQVLPRQADTLHQLGIIVYQSGRSAEGIDLVGKAIAANGTVAAFHSNLCEMCRLTGLLAEALAAGRQAVALAPGLPQAHANLGIAHFELGDCDQAIECYRRALALDARLAEVHSNLGNVLRVQGKLAEAVEAHQRAIALKPDYADGHNNLGTVLRDMRRYPGAEAHYRQALGLKPQNPAILNNLALAILPQRRLDEALALLSRSAGLDPHNVQTFVLLASLLSKRKQYDRAKAACERALALHPDHPEVLNVLGCIALDQGRIDEAIDLYQRALISEPSLAHAHNNLGNALKQLGRLEQACISYRAALAIEPQLASAHLALADLHTFVSDDAELAVMEHLAETIEELGEEERTQLHFALAKAYGDVRRHDHSFSHLLQGNAIKRGQVDYDEQAILGLFDRIRGVFTAALLHGKKGSGDPSAAPVLIVGMPRSGTTLIEQVLASHPRVFGAGELFDLRDVIAEHCDLAAVPSPYPECVGEMPAEVPRQIGAAYAARLQRHAPDAVCVTDKMPSNFFHIGLLHLALPNARIIHVRRDPLDTCLSCFARLFGDDQPFAYDLSEIGRYYRAYSDLMAHWRQVLPRDAMLEVQYEALVADFAPQARRILAYCGLDWDDACLRFYETQRPVRTASAAQVRQPLYQSAVGRWRAYEPRLGPLIEALGDLGG
jgi:tetratricopeptide (TPR) repeat protein